mgnify:CR=1 FL=1
MPFIVIICLPFLTIQTILVLCVFGVIFLVPILFTWAIFIEMKRVNTAKVSYILSGAEAIINYAWRILLFHCFFLNHFDSEGFRLWAEIRVSWHTHNGSHRFRWAIGGGGDFCYYFWYGIASWVKVILFLLLFHFKSGAFKISDSHQFEGSFTKVYKYGYDFRQCLARSLCGPMFNLALGWAVVNWLNAWGRINRGELTECVR